MARRMERLIVNEADLLAWEAEIDTAICGFPLDEQLETRLAAQGAHDPTPTFYFILQELFRHYAFDEHTHLLDVGCGTGRVLAHFVRERLAGRATGIELDAQLAQRAAIWTRHYPQIDVLQGNVLDLDLNEFTDFYLFNPFDQGILQRFIEQLESQLAHPSTIVHMSDNGDTWHYVGRPGWTELASGSFQYFRNARGYHVKVYDHPQHYTAWRFDPTK